MLKRTAMIILIAVIIISAANTGLASPKIGIYINGVLTTGDVQPCLVNGRVMVPIRVIADSLGCRVIWDSHSNSVIIESERPLELMKVNGEKTTWPYWYENGVLFMEYRNALELVRQAHSHPHYVLKFSVDSESLMLNDRYIDVPCKTKGDYKVVSLNHLKLQKLINYDWDEKTANLTLKLID